MNLTHQIIVVKDLKQRRGWEQILSVFYSQLVDVEPCLDGLFRTKTHNSRAAFKVVPNDKVEGNPQNM